MSARPVPRPPTWRPEPPQRREPAVVVPLHPPAPVLDPQLSVAYWNHPCGRGCATWVPNHRQRCAVHE